MKYGIMLSFLVLVSMAGAELETVEMGPYEVSFDMGDIEYEALGYTVDKVGEGETYCMCYMCSILPNDDQGFIQIQCENCNSVIPNEYNFKAFCNRMDLFPATYFRTVDDKNVVMIVGTGIDYRDDTTREYALVYTLESDSWYDSENIFTADYCNNANATLVGQNFISIFSNADWDATRQLLNTIHVERISD